MPDPVKWLNWSDQDIAHAYEQGASIRAIAAQCGASPPTVGKILRRQGIEIRQRMQLPEAEIIDSYRQGSSMQAIADAHKVSRNVIRELLIRHEVDRRDPSEALSENRGHRPRLLAPEQRDEAVRLYQQGMSAAAVAGSLGTAKTTIQRVLHEEGVMRPPRNERPVPEPDSDVMQEIGRRYQQGAPIQVLAREYGLARSTLQSRLTTLGLRPPRNAK